jgi:hypothetical protein
MEKGRLIEVVDGIEVREKPVPDALAMVAGRRGRLEAGGVVYEVDRVSDCAAYLHKVYDPPRTVQIEDRTIQVSRGPVEPGISAKARFVERVA